MTRIDSLTDLDIYLFKQGRHTRLYEQFGAHPISIDKPGTRFVVWAPNASQIKRPFSPGVGLTDT